MFSIQFIQKNQLKDQYNYFSTFMDQHYYEVLKDTTKPIGQRYQAIFHLKNINTENSVKLLIDSYKFTEGSVLLTHEILYALGQVDEEHVILVKDFLFEKVKDEKESGVARHQAAQALANYFHLIPDLDKFFIQYVNSDCKELSDTCKISLQKARHQQLKDHYGHKYFSTKQPAAPFTKQQFERFLQEKELENFFGKTNFLGLLLKPEEQISLFQKYRIMYYMRDLGTQNQIETFCRILSKKYFKTQSSLLKHEICFILGQIGCGQHENLIRQCMENSQESDIVRHEALAAVASQSKDIQYLKKFTEHQNRLIRQSAQVAQFTIKYWCQ